MDEYAHDIVEIVRVHFPVLVPVPMVSFLKGVARGQEFFVQELDAFRPGLKTVHSDPS